VVQAASNGASAGGEREREREGFWGVKAWFALADLY
jgi:hypothetical protein